MRAKLGEQIAPQMYPYNQYVTIKVGVRLNLWVISTLQRYDSGEKVTTELMEKSCIETSREYDLSINSSACNQLVTSIVHHLHKTLTNKELQK